MAVILSRVDPLNRVVDLHEGDWRYIVSGHSELNIKGMVMVVARAIAQPDLITIDVDAEPGRERRCYYLRGALTGRPRSAYLKVVVEFAAFDVSGRQSGHVVTAFAVVRPKRQEVPEWTR